MGYYQVRRDLGQNRTSGRAKCRERDSNPHAGCPAADFKSAETASFAIPAGHVKGPEVYAETPSGDSSPSLLAGRSTDIAGRIT